MSSSQDSESLRAAALKADKGARLLNTGEYEGAIVACTEAIELYPGSIGARRTRAEAYRRLGKEKEAKDDLWHLDVDDRLRETTLDEGDPRAVLCAHLRGLGVKARQAGHVTHLSSFSQVTEYTIDVVEGQIPQILIWEEYNLAGWGGDDYASREIRYLIPDSRIGQDFSIGGVHGDSVGWKEDISEESAFWAELISRLTQDESVTAALVGGKRDLRIRADDEHGCWVLTEGTWTDSEPPFGKVCSTADAVGKHVPSRLRWDGYQAIASHLLAMPLPT